MRLLAALFFPSSVEFVAMDDHRFSVLAWEEKRRRVGGDVFGDERRGGEAVTEAMEKGVDFTCGASVQE